MMWRHMIYRAVLAGLLSVSPLHAQRVSMNQVWNSLPDFVCSERVVSSTVRKGKTREQHIVQSVFMTQRKTQTRPGGASVVSIVESREVLTIDGKKAPKDAPMPSSPLFFDGLAANILFISDIRPHQLGPAANVEGRLTIRIGYTTRNSREFLQLEFPAAVSDVQMDTQSGKALFVESRLGFKFGGSGVPVSAEFQSIEIDGKAYWLPRLVKADAPTEKDEMLTYSAEYTDCKKFEVKVQIRPAEVPEVR